MVESGGFRVDRLTFDHASLLPILLPVRVWHRLSAGDGDVPAGEDEITVPSPPVNAALSALVSLEALLLRAVNMPIGSSLMCLARKSVKHCPILDTLRDKRQSRMAASFARTTHN